LSVKKFVLAAVVGIVTMVLCVAVVGYLLPQSHVAALEGTFAAAPAVVFDTIADVARYPEWRSDLGSVELLSTSPLRWREHSGSETLTFEAVETKRPDLLQVRIADTGLPFGGTWTYELTPDGSGTKVKITERGEVYNPIFRFVARFIIGHTSTIETFLAALHRRLDR
jgi:hypothetical protein